MLSKLLRELYIHIVTRLHITSNSHVRYTEFKVVSGPILEHRRLLRLLILHGEVRKEHRRSITRDEDKQMPQCMEIREV